MLQAIHQRIEAEVGAWRFKYDLMRAFGNNRAKSFVKAFVMAFGHRVHIHDKYWF
jgi:hypothetical protein